MFLPGVDERPTRTQVDVRTIEGEPDLDVLGLSDQF
jgi:hypothetical protein